MISFWAIVASVSPATTSTLTSDGVYWEARVFVYWSTVCSVSVHFSPAAGVPLRTTCARVVAVRTWTSLFSPPLEAGLKAWRES